MAIKLNFEVRQVEANERPLVAAFLEAQWGSVQIVSRGCVHEADQLPAYFAIWDDQLVGLVTYHIKGDECEIVSLDSLMVRIGVGGALIEAVVQKAAYHNCKRLWLITSNDNLTALGFYQRRGFRLVAVYQGAIDASRKIKPSIPFIGMDNIPIHDEIELELWLQAET
ncbi:MAG: GNAT family N-acetyltransferase [Chloroflexi bacterium]|nr:GNAT family N-acetyltransferase [Chloroflexota bacterium]